METDAQSNAGNAGETPPTPPPARVRIPPDEAVRKWEERQKEKEAKRAIRRKSMGMTHAEKVAATKGNLEKAREARRIKLAQREMVRRKVEAGLPISPEEREIYNWNPGGPGTTAQRNKKVLDAALAQMTIKPQSVQELRLLVEKTAAKHSYNPIESLILQTQDKDIPEKEKIAIHKALLPFLIPQLATPKPDAPEGGGGVRVTVTQFVFQDKGTKPIHEEKPAMVTIEANPTQP